jgi:hypothetical protein
MSHRFADRGLQYETGKSKPVADCRTSVAIRRYRMPHYPS